MTKIYCDRCGKDITPFFYYELQMDDTGPYDNEREFDLCKECANELVEWIFAKEKEADEAD